MPADYRRFRPFPRDFTGLGRFGGFFAERWGAERRSSPTSFRTARSSW